MRAALILGDLLCGVPMVYAQPSSACSKKRNVCTVGMKPLKTNSGVSKPSRWLT